MTATCYRCTALSITPAGEPFGSCHHCQSFACITCGARTARISRFYCVTCKAGITLLPSAGLPPTGGGPPAAAGVRQAPKAGGPGDMVPLYESTGHFEVVEPELAQNTANERRYYACDIDRFLAAPADYAFEEAQRDRVADPLAPQPTEA